jgi:hypothetical protein
MKGRRISRRTLLLTAGTLPLAGVLPARALAASGVTGVTWDAEKGRMLWRRPDGPLFTFVDTVSLTYDGKTKPPPALPLRPEQVREVTTALVAASKFYAGIGMDAPAMPLMDGRFVVAFLSQMGNTNGAAGLARGLDEGLLAVLTGTPAFPEGVYLMVNADNYLNPDPDDPWGPRTTLAHELLHCIDNTMVPDNAWKNNIGKWWTEGEPEAAAQHAYRELGYDPLDVQKLGARIHAPFVGMRPYDVPLTLRNVPDYRPSWVRKDAPIGAGEAEDAAYFWDKNASYFTSSFWRYLLKEEAPYVQPPKLPQPGYFELLPKLRRYKPTDADKRRVEGNAYMDPGIPLLDRFLRAEHPVWRPTGLYRAFPAFIAHFVEWPDQIVKSRAGLFAHPKWLGVLFMKDAPTLVLTENQPIEIDLEIDPLAASAIRFELPADVAGTGYPAVTIGVSVVKDFGQKNAIDNVHVGLRGQCLANQYAQMSGNGRSRVRRWINLKANPLNRRATKGETVLTLINVAPDPVETGPIRVRLSVVVQLATTAGQCSYHPEPVADENGDPVVLVASVAPTGPATIPVVATTRGSAETKITMVKNADIVRMMTAMGDVNTLMAIERVTDDPDPKPDSGAMAAKMSAAMMAGTLNALSVELTLPRIEPDFVGSVSGAKVAAEWHEPRYARYARYGVSPGVRIETDSVKVQVTGSTDSALLGTFAADFDTGSNNQNRAFRGQIEGRFSIGIANDDAQENGELPADPSAMLPTDFFVAAARAGMDSSQIAEMMQEARANLEEEPSPDPVTATGASGGVFSTGDSQADQCLASVTRADLELYLDQYIRSLPGISAGQIAEIRASMLNDWEGSRYILCLWKQGLM